MEDLQMVKQIPGLDKREKVIQLTELGEQIYQACRKKITELEISVMHGIANEEQMITFQTLPKIQENIMKGDGTKNE